jgi:hypothetical protein
MVGLVATATQNINKLSPILSKFFICLGHPPVKIFA